MSVESAAPANARMVYTLLIIAGVTAALIGAIMIGVITYNYVTRPELRDPVEGLYQGPHGSIERQATL